MICNLHIQPPFFVLNCLQIRIKRITAFFLHHNICNYSFTTNEPAAYVVFSAGNDIDGGFCICALYRRTDRHGKLAVRVGAEKSKTGTLPLRFVLFIQNCLFPHLTGCSVLLLIICNPFLCCDHISGICQSPEDADTGAFIDISAARASLNCFSCACSDMPLSDLFLMILFITVWFLSGIYKNFLKNAHSSSLHILASSDLMLQ